MTHGAKEWRARKDRDLNQLVGSNENLETILLQKFLENVESEIMGAATFAVGVSQLESTHADIDRGVRPEEVGKERVVSGIGNRGDWSHNRLHLVRVTTRNAETLRLSQT